MNILIESFVPFICINSFHAILLQNCCIFHTSTHWLLYLEKYNDIVEWNWFSIFILFQSLCLLSLLHPVYICRYRCLLVDCMIARYSTIEVQSFYLVSMAVAVLLAMLMILQNMNEQLQQQIKIETKDEETDLKLTAFHAFWLQTDFLDFFITAIEPFRCS